MNAMTDTRHWLCMRKGCWYTMLLTAVLITLVRSAWGDSADAESLVVNTKQGSVRGYKNPDGDFYVFYGVPYATAPTGSQRFQAPLPPPMWLDTFEAIDRNIVCPQFNYLDLVLKDNKKEKENCLVTNIYIPRTEDKSLPVLVYVHGGGYNIGFSDLTTYKHLVMSKKVIVVTFNYRLGAHGFLCLGTKDVPGNAGMKDQVTLLRWIKHNIANFGGNPDDVTIAGYSAGSSSVDLLTISKMANGLFNKVIAESGANIATFSVQVDPTEVAKNYALKLNFSNVDDIYALEKFYKTASYNLLTSVDVFAALDGTFSFTPCVERDTGVERFLDDSPMNILKSGNYQKRPMLYGFATMEGMLRLNLFEEWKKLMNTKFSDFLPADLQYQSQEEKEEVAAKIKIFYFGTKPVTGDTVMGYIDYFTDTIFAYSSLVSIRLQVEAGNDQIYLYEYAYADESSPIIPFIGAHGADHCAQTFAIQDGLNLTHPDESIASDGYKKMKRIVREMWLNFVTTSKPVPEGSSLPSWRPTGANASPYMVLDLVPELKKTPMLEKRTQFWDQIYSKHYRHPVPPKTPRLVKQEL